MNILCRCKAPTPLFAVYAKDGRIMMQTDSPACVPPPDILKALKAAGYKIKERKQ